MDIYKKNLTMYSYKKTSKAFSIAGRLKKASDDKDLHNSIDAFFASLGANAIVITDDVDPAAIIIGDDVDPANAIVIPDDVDPVKASLNSAIDELKRIKQDQKKDSITTACNDLIAKISAMVDAIDSL